MATVVADNDNQLFTQQACVQGIYCASVSNIDSAVAGTAYVVCAEAFIFWLYSQAPGYKRYYSQCFELTFKTQCYLAGIEHPHPDFHLSHLTLDTE